MNDEKKQFYKMVFALVLPMALQNLINVGVTSADVIMLGRVGGAALSASSLAGQVYFILNLVYFGLTSGAAVITAQYSIRISIHQNHREGTGYFSAFRASCGGGIHSGGLGDSGTDYGASYQ